MATKLNLGAARRGNVGGPITRLSGRFTTGRSGFAAIFVTDCKMTIKLNAGGVVQPNVPTARPSFSVPGTELRKTVRLDAKRDWYVYLQLPPRGSVRKEFSNAWIFPKDKLTGADTGKNITAIKKANLKKTRQAIRRIDSDIKRLDRDAERQLARADSFDFFNDIAEFFRERADIITNDIARLARAREMLEMEAAERERDLQIRFGVSVVRKKRSAAKKTEARAKSGT